MSGIGINLREVPDDNGDVKVKVLGLVLDGPAHLAGVRQVSIIPMLTIYISIWVLAFSLAINSPS